MQETQRLIKTDVTIELLPSFLLSCYFRPSSSSNLAGTHPTTSDGRAMDGSSDPCSILHIRPMCSILQVNLEVIERLCRSEGVDPSWTMVVSLRSRCRSKQERRNIPIKTFHAPFLDRVGLIYRFRPRNNVKCVLGIFGFQISMRVYYPSGWLIIST
jgi:hypothetical protein